MKDNEYLEKLFLEYLPTMEALNELTQSLYSKDEYKLRHRIFKQVYKEYRAYKLKLFVLKLKNKFRIFKFNLQEKRKNKIVNDYNKLKEKGEFLPKEINL